VGIYLKKPNPRDNLDSFWKINQLKYKMSEENIIEQQAWYQNRMEIDKQILLLSSLGIGALITFNFNPSSPYMFWFWLISGICFLSCIALVLIIYHKNADYLKYSIEEEKEKEAQESKKLSYLSSFTYVLFVIAVLLMGTFVVLIKLAGIQSLE
jgi:Ca2+/Na+ antiporter